ncbi:MAG: hypothetical protein FWE83_07420 [Oscillospiraceae bacterium]|nr:hypothetical protein [Oscillospiraceae bacterium]
MKKHLSKKRIYAILISISMLVSSIVMIPIPIAHVSAEDLYSAETPAEYAEPITLTVDDDGESIDLNTNDDDTTYNDISDIYDISDDGEGYDENNHESNHGSSDGSSDSDSTICEYCEEDVYVCEHSDIRQCTICNEDVCVCNTDGGTDNDTIQYAETESYAICYLCGDKCGDKCSDMCGEMCGEACGEEACLCDICEYCEEECTCDICEYCEGECTCDVIDFSKIRGGVLIATDINRFNYLENVIAGNVNEAQAADFVGDANAVTINAAIKAGTPVIAQISSGFILMDTITVPGGHNIIINSESGNFPLTMLRDIRHFIIDPGATLTLQSAHLSAFQSPNPAVVDAGSMRGGITVDGGTLIIENGTRIINNHNRSANDGGGALTINSGQVIMNGGEITGNRATTGNGGHRGGGGVLVGPGGSFTMNGGIIDNNNAVFGGSSGGILTGGGGVYVLGQFILNDGTISNNKTNHAPGPQHGGGGVFIAPGGSFTIHKGVITNNTSESLGGVIILSDNATLNLYGGGVYGNNAGNSKGITWVGGTINLRNHPIVGYNDNDDYIHRYTTTNNPNQIINLVGPVGNFARINIRDHITDIGRPDYTDDLTVIARMIPGGFASARVASQFHYLNNSEVKTGWRVAARDPGNNNLDLILERIPDTSRFAFIMTPDDIYFGERDLYTTNLAGPYGDAPGASNVEADYASGGPNGYENWLYRFMVVNTRYDVWSMTLQTTPFVTTDGIVGAIPVALRNGESDPTPIDLTSAPLQVFSSDIKNAILVWHWTQLQYRIEAQTKMDTVVPGDYKSVFTWTLQDVPT